MSIKSGVPPRRYSGSNFGISYSVEWLSFKKFVLDSMLFGQGMEWLHLQFSLCGVVTTWWVLVMVSMHSQYLTGPARLILLYHCRSIYDGDRGSLGRPRKFTVEYLVNRIIYALTSGCPWRMIPVESGS